MAYVYILRCSDDSYYIGSTHNLEKRLVEHKSGKGAKHTQDRLPVELAYAEKFTQIAFAFSREKQLQGWTRKKKEALISGKIRDKHVIFPVVRQHDGKTSLETVPEQALSEQRESKGASKGRSAPVPEQAPSKAEMNAEGPTNEQALSEQRASKGRTAPVPKQAPSKAKMRAEGPTNEQALSEQRESKGASKGRSVPVPEQAPSKAEMRAEGPTNEQALSEQRASKGRSAPVPEQAPSKAEMHAEGPTNEQALSEQRASKGAPNPQAPSKAMRSTKQHPTKQRAQSAGLSTSAPASAGEIVAGKTPFDASTFAITLTTGIPTTLPPPRVPPTDANRAPRRKDILSAEEKKLALRNALRYFPAAWHQTLLPEIRQELEDCGRIYMYRFKPDYEMHARPITDYPGKSAQARAIMLMIQNNLDPAVAQHPEELITYGGNGSVFQNWAQYLLTMRYLSEMTDEQTLHLYSGHPMGLFPSTPEAPRVVVTNGMMIPNYSQPDDWEKFNALGVTQYGQMTAGSFMYIGPQGIVHGTTITVMNAFRKMLRPEESIAGKIFLTAGLGGMSGAQPKAGNIAGCITVCAEVNPAAARKRHAQGWVDELVETLDDLVARTRDAMEGKRAVSIAYLGNVIDVWERFLDEDIYIHVGSDQTSLHNPWSGGYYPAGYSFAEASQLLAEDPAAFKVAVQESLRRHAAAINAHTAKGTYFFDYGNAFLLEASRAGAEVMAEDGNTFRYPSYVQDILGPMCFDYGFGPFRWVCTSGKPEDLRRTDDIALTTLQGILRSAPSEIAQQLQDNITWIKEAEAHELVVGSQARILYADAQGRTEIALAFNRAIAAGELGPVVLGRDHHDVSGTDSPYRETSNIYDGSRFTADMAIHNVIGDSFRGASWVSIHNGGGVGWGEVINGGFGLLLDGSPEAENRLRNMLFFDVNNGIARRSWARNEEAIFAIKREMERTPNLVVTLPNVVVEDLFTIYE